MSIRLGQLVERLGGQLIGDENIEISGIAPLDDADASHVTFLSNPKLRTRAAQTKAAALILSAADDAVVAQEYKGARIVTNNPYAYFARTAQWFAAERAIVPPPGIHPAACVDPSAQIASSAYVGPHVVVEAGASIGEGCIVDAGCFIGRNAHLGAQTHFHARVTFHADCRIGELVDDRSGIAGLQEIDHRRGDAGG